MQENEQQIIAGLRDESKREDAFQLLIRKYQERLYWHIRKIVISHDDTNDVLQNTFLKAWKNIDHFRAESSLFTWFYRIATNESITFLNSKKKRNMVPMSDDNQYLQDNLLSDPYFEGDAIQLKLQQAILRLPDKQRLVFNMKYFDELKYEEMSKILDTSVGALKASYHHAVKKIEEYLKHNN